MRRVGITAQALSPLALGRRTAYGHFIETHPYLPGGTWRGAVAAALLQRCPDPARSGNCQVGCPLREKQTGTCHFGTLFLAPEPAIFTALYPCDRVGTSFPTPLTVYTCKRYGGSRAQRAYEVARQSARARSAPQPHGLCDLLGHGGALTCAVCGEDLAPFSAPFLRPLSGGGYTVVAAPTTVQTHVAINRRRHSAEPGMLYSVDALERQGRFAGALLLPDALPEEVVVALGQFLRGFADQETALPVGGGVSRGLGAVALGWDAEPENEEPPLEERFAAWQPQAPGGAGFVVTLAAEALLQEPVSGAPVVGLTAEVLLARLAELTSAPLPTLRLSAAYHRPALVSGWSTAWELPKLSALGTSRGSVAVFAIAPGSVPLSGLLEALARLEEEGLGERRAEGYGQLRVCHPIHAGGTADVH